MITGKRITAFLLFILLISGFALSLCSCNIKSLDSYYDDKIAAGDSPEQEVGFVQGTKNLSVALALALNGLDKSYLDYENIVWDVVGFYCAVKHAAGGTISLAYSNAIELQRAVRPGKEPFEISDISYSKGITQSEEKLVLYLVFKPYQSYYEAVSAQYDIDAVCDEKSGTVAVTLSQGDEKRSFDFTFKKGNGVSTLFPFCLSDISLPDAFLTENKDELSFEKIIAANTSENLVKEYSSVRFSKSESGNEYMTGYVFDHSGHIITACKSKVYNEELYSFGFDSLPFEKYMDSFYCYVNADNEFSGEEKALSNIVGCNVEPGRIVNTVSKDSEYYFDIQNRFTGETDQSLVVNKSDLSLVKVTKNKDEERKTEISFDYGVEVNDFGFLKRFGAGETKNVEMIVKDKEENLLYTRRFSGLGGNFEIVPCSVKEYELLNEDGSEYSYPGDGVSYSVTIIIKEPFVYTTAKTEYMR
ncbi:MAG: hypothetical protein K6B52_06375 [Clostridiales bacterium]|nr:hypothetical protein [Clostridiales bacterium]